MVPGISYDGAWCHFWLGYQRVLECAVLEISMMVRPHTVAHLQSTTHRCNSVGLRNDLRVQHYYLLPLFLRSPLS